MKLTWYFWILAILAVGTVSALGFALWPQHQLLFWTAEGLALAVLVLFVSLYRKSVRPYRILFNGIDLLKEQDFASRLRPMRNREANRLIEVFNKMSAQLKTERAQVREKNHFLDLLIQASPQGVIVLDFDERVSQVNPAGLKLLHIDDVSQIEGRTLDELPMGLARELAKIPPYGDSIVRTPDRAVYRCIRSSFVDSGFVHPFLLVEELTLELLRLEKTSYERIIRMISHEVNNSMGAIGSTLDVLADVLQQNEQPDGAELLPAVQAAYERCNHMAQFTNKLADMVRIPEPTRSRIGLNELIRSVEAVIRSECRKRRIALKLELTPDELPVDVDGIQFEQVLVNILKNAYEAIGSGGEIRITTTVSPLSVTIEDNGPGIPEEVNRKLFTPFFTTKPSGQGIGLMFVREVLDNHALPFSLASTPGRTAFTIRFPSASRS